MRIRAIKNNPYSLCTSDNYECVSCENYGYQGPTLISTLELTCVQPVG